MKVRVRFAPSPTGALHIGGVRTALYNFLLARQTGGTMILRIEDTDQSRFVPGAEEYILKSLAWAGIQIDEGVSVGGPYAPYHQSQRKDIYRKHAQQLVDRGHAYYAFDTEADLEAMRQRTPNAQYDASTRLQMKNALTLPADEVTRRVASEPYVIRLKVPASEEISLDDLIRGHVSVLSSQLDDKVLMKSDGMPTYHLANVVDDYLMKITHVIRGEEWLPSAPHHVLLYRCFGWEGSMPRFAHLPLLLKPDGNGKLSKRDADRMGFPIFPLNWTDPKSGERSSGFREQGYLPEALLNFLALLGWNPGTPQELFTLEELIKAFSLEHVHKAGARFDIQKAQWFNQQYLRNLPTEILASFLLAELESNNIHASVEIIERVVTILKPRVTFPQDFWEMGRVFFERPSSYDKNAIAKHLTPDVVKALEVFRQRIVNSGTANVLTPETAKSWFDESALSVGLKPSKALAALRYTVTGSFQGPDLMETISTMGSTETGKRIENFLSTPNNG